MTLWGNKTEAITNWKDSPRSQSEKRKTMNFAEYNKWNIHHVLLKVAEDGHEHVIARDTKQRL